MLWRRIAWFSSFAIAVLLALWMRSLDYGWPATIGAAVVTWVVLPFVISQLFAAFMLARTHWRIGRAGGLEDMAENWLKPENLRQQAKRARSGGDEALAQAYERMIANIEKKRGSR